MESWEEAKTLTFWRGRNVPTLFFSKSTKEVLNVQEALISQTKLLTMTLGQAFRNITWQTLFTSDRDG